MKSPATPEVIDEYVSGARFGDNDSYIQAARDAASEYLKRQVHALNESKDVACTVEDIAGQHIIYVDGFAAGARWALEKAFAANDKSSRL